MATDAERIDKLESDMVDMKVRVGIAEGDISAIKGTLNKIERNISKILWSVAGTFTTLILGIILALINHYLR